VASGDGYVSGSLINGTVIKRDDSFLVPLLHPGNDKQLPFGAALELQAPSLPIEGNYVGPLSILPKNKDIYELRFVLDGSGTLVYGDGRHDELRAGDTVLMTQGSAECVPDSSESILSSNIRWSMASLVVYMPKRLVELAGGESGKSGAQQECCELIRRFTDDKWTGVPIRDTLSRALVEKLLAGAKNIALLPNGSSDKDLTGGTQGEEPSGHEGKSLWGALTSTWSQIYNFFGSGDSLPTLHRSLNEIITFQLPNQTNRLALVFDPLTLPPVPFVCGLEIFEPGHTTPPHVHVGAHEVFFLLSGEGQGFCNGKDIPLAPGDIVAFRPGSSHGLVHNGGDKRAYCLMMMMPNEHFAEFVRAGQNTGTLGVDDLCVLAKLGCA